MDQSGAHPQKGAPVGSRLPSRTRAPERNERKEEGEAKQSLLPWSLVNWPWRGRRMCDWGERFHTAVCVKRWQRFLVPCCRGEGGAGKAVVCVNVLVWNEAAVRAVSPWPIFTAHAQLEQTAAAAAAAAAATLLRIVPADARTHDAAEALRQTGRVERACVYIHTHARKLLYLQPNTMHDSRNAGKHSINHTATYAGVRCIFTSLAF